MTCYLPPIDKPDAIYNIQILRFDPEKDRYPHWESYQVPFVRTMTVIEALEYLWDQGEYIAFRSNCREFTCGSCAMEINGKPALACDTLLEDGMRIEPLSRFPVIKDLVVDTSTVPERFKALKLWPECKHREPATKDSPPLPAAKSAIEHYRETYSRCIECYSCLDACPQSDSDESPYFGPLYMLQLARVMEHPLDEKDRVAQAAEAGISHCINCYECANVCPMNLSPATIVNELRSKTIRRLDLLFGRRRKEVG